MTVRKQTLEEWFLMYQLKAMSRSHFYNPITLDVDVTRIAALFSDEPNPPYTAIMMKALATVAETHPFINRMVFSTFYGVRVVDFEDININFPHMITDGGRDYLIASTLPQADKKSVSEIRAFIKQACKKKLSDTFISKHFEKSGNTPWMRAYLRFIHFCAYNFPGLYLKKGGGGLSVSSLMNLSHEDFSAHVLAFGPTAMTLCAASAAPTSDGRTVLKLAVGWDHFSGHGNDHVGAIRELSRVLTAKSDDLLELFSG